MHDLVKPLLLLAIVLAVPIVPFVLFGDRLEPRMLGWLDERVSPAMVAALVIGLLASDILLPVPSSATSAFAGHMLGFWGGTLASWAGMMLGCVVAFALARAFGRPLALWFSKEEDLGRIDRLSGQYGTLVLILARPVPVLAEASVLLFGATRLSWRRFLAAITLSNLGIAAVYALLGEQVDLLLALIASIALPLVLMALARLWWPADTR